MILHSAKCNITIISLRYVVTKVKVLMVLFEKRFQYLYLTIKGSCRPSTNIVLSTYSCHDMSHGKTGNVIAQSDI